MPSAMGRKGRPTSEARWDAGHRNGKTRRRGGAAKPMGNAFTLGADYVPVRCDVSFKLTTERLWKKSSSTSSVMPPLLARMLTYPAASRGR
jgi:hypothetical protein